MFSKLRNYHTIIFKLILFLVTTLIIVFMFPKKGSFQYEFQKGAPWLHETLIAPYDFPILKSNESIEQEKSKIIDSHRLTLVFDASLFNVKAEEFIIEFEEKWSRDKKIKNTYKLQVCH